MISRNKILANRGNGLKGGVRTPQGKAISRLNARKHGIFAAALTSEDSKELHGFEQQLFSALKPEGMVEQMLVEKLALTYLRIQRCARAEAEYHIRTWEKPDAYENEYWEKRRQRGLRSVPFRSSSFKDMVEIIDLYDTRLTNQFLKLLHEIERQQRLRAGENVPPPVVADLTIHADAGTPRESDAALQERASTAPFDVQSPGKTLSEGPQKSQDTVVQEDTTQKVI